MNSRQTLVVRSSTPPCAAGEAPLPGRMPFLPTASASSRSFGSANRTPRRSCCSREAGDENRVAVAGAHPFLSPALSSRSKAFASPEPRYDRCHPMTLQAGTRLGPYEIVSPIGAGGMGEVYKAKDARLGRDVAIKVLPSHLTDDPDLKARFEREARAISQLTHPHICTLYD